MEPLEASLFDDVAVAEAAAETELVLTAVDDLRLEIAERDEELRTAVLELAEMCGRLAAGRQAASEAPRDPDLEAVLAASQTASRRIDELRRIVERLESSTAAVTAGLEQVVQRLGSVEQRLEPLAPAGRSDVLDLRSPAA